MNSSLKSFIKTGCYITLYSLFILCCSVLFKVQAHANPCQVEILNAGINLGWAKATLDLRGDRIQNNAEFIVACLTRAAIHIRNGSNCFFEPYRTDRRIERIDQRVIDMINRYPRQAPRLSLAHRANYIKRIWSRYSQSFQTTFTDRPRSNTDRTTGYHYYPNCDLFILNVGYHFGRAHIASQVTGNRTRTYQNGANGSMRLAMRSGLNVALDGYPYGANPYGPQTNVRKACCSFGRPNEWKTLPTFQFNSPNNLYAGNLSNLQRIVFEANLPLGACTLDCSHDYCDCSSDKKVPMPPLVKLTKDEAKKAIDNAGLKAQILQGSPAPAPNMANRVESQFPHIGALICTNEIVKLRIYSAVKTEQELCSRDFPGSVPGGRNAEGKVICNCPRGYVWNASRTRCIRKPSGTDPMERCDHLISQIKNFMAMYRRDPGNNSHLKGIAEGNARQARNLGCNQNRINQALGTGEDVDHRPRSCRDSGMTNINTLIDPPPYSGKSPICRDGSGTLWIQTGSRIYKVNSIVRGRQNRQTGCYDGSKVITQSKTFLGILCGP